MFSNSQLWYVANHAMECLEERQLSDHVVGMSLCPVIIDQHFCSKNWHVLFHLACRHHIIELFAWAACTTIFGSSSFPEIAMFKRFYSSWNFTVLCAVSHRYVNTVNNCKISSHGHCITQQRRRKDFANTAKVHCKEARPLLVLWAGNSWPQLSKHTTYVGRMAGSVNFNLL